jgi:ferredoxin-NADP reductase
MLWLSVLHAAAEPSEFALLKQLLQWQQKGAIHMQLHTTRTHGLPPALQDFASQQQQQQQLQGAAAAQHVELPLVVQGRIGNADLKAALQQLLASSHTTNSSGSAVGVGMQDVTAYVCGPPQMSDGVVQALHGLGLADSAVHTERWW